MEDYDRIVIIGDEAMTLGFRLAGVDECYTLPPEEGVKKLEELTKEKDVGIVIVDWRVKQLLHLRLAKQIEQIAKPVVVFIPDREEAKGAPAETLSATIKKALGVELMK